MKKILLLGFMLVFIFPIFSTAADDSKQVEFKFSGLRCKVSGQKKMVWINTKHGSYALNGHAIKWVNSSKAMGYPITGSDGKEMKIGRDYISAENLYTLIKEGLNRCD